MHALAVASDIPMHILLRVNGEFACAHVYLCAMFGKLAFFFISLVLFGQTRGIDDCGAYTIYSVCFRFQ